MASVPGGEVPEAAEPLRGGAAVGLGVARVDVERVRLEHAAGAEAARRPVVVVRARRLLVDRPAVLARVVHARAVRVHLPAHTGTRGYITFIVI